MILLTNITIKSSKCQKVSIIKCNNFISIDEIPIVLFELNESALSYIAKDQYEKALLLLQKAHGVLDVVDLSGSKRDQMIAVELFLNMALCYQKLG